MQAFQASFTNIRKLRQSKICEIALMISVTLRKVLSLDQLKDEIYVSPLGIFFSVLYIIGCLLNIPMECLLPVDLKSLLVTPSSPFHHHTHTY